MMRGRPGKDGVISRREAAETQRDKVMSVIAALLIAFSLAFVTGCRSSDALTEVIYDQTSTNVDYGNERKYLLNDSQAETKDERVPAQESDNSGRVTEEKQNIAVYSSNPNAPQFTAKQSVWSSDPDFPGLEASSSVRFYESDDPEATEQDIQTTQEEQPQDPQVEEEAETGLSSDQGAGGTGESAESGKRASLDAKDRRESQAESGEGGEGDDQTETPDDQDQGETPQDDPGVTGSEETPAPVQDTSGNYTQLPTVSHIAAVGQIAVVVQMIGGQGALVAADSSLLDSSFATVFADEGAANIVRGWSDGGTPAGIDMEAIAASGAQLLIVDRPDYTEGMSNEQRKKLNKLLADGTITQVMYADLSNTTAIKNFVRKVGESLRDSTEIGNAGNTVSLASSYISFHDGLVSQCANNNGGLAYDAVGGFTNVYELGGNSGKLSTGEQLAFNGNANFTLLVDAWDPSVRYTHGEPWNPKMSGLALSYVGYANSPVSYYIQAGGLVNNAASRGEAGSPGLYPVWQFSSLPLLKSVTYAVYAVGGAFDQSVTPSERRSAGTAWDPILLTTSLNLASGSAGSGSSYGSSVFPKLIAATREIKDQIIANSDGAEEVYHPYETLTSDVRGTRGYVASDGGLMYSCIGATGASDSVETTIGDAITENDIVVNPHGLFSSWTEYGSVEGVLEAAWINDVVNGENGAVGWRDKVVEFYNTFYRFDCSGYLSTIEGGIAG